LEQACGTGERGFCKEAAHGTLRGMRHITTRSPVVRTAHARAAAGLLGVGLYVVGCWCSYRTCSLAGLVRSTCPRLGLHRRSPSSTFHVPAATPADRGANALRVLIVSVVDGPTYSRLAAPYLVAADEITVTRTEFAGISGLRDCV